MRSDGAAHGKHPIMSVTALRPWRFLVSLRGPCAASRPIACPPVECFTVVATLTLTPNS
jgi:hypothetical protein